MRRLHLIVNPAAGRVEESTVQQLAATWRAAGHPVRVTHSRSIAAANAVIADCAARDERAVLFGGDGFLHTMVGPLVAHGIEFGLLPGGRGNDFARQLGLPTDPAAAAEVAANADVRPVDALRVESASGVAYAAGSVYAGLDSQVSHLVNGYRRVPAAVQYQLGAVHAILTFAPRTFRVEVDGVWHEYEGISAIAANSGFYGGGMHIAPDARPDDGLLDVVLLGAPSRARLLRLLPTVYRGTHIRQPEVQVVRGRRVRVESTGVAAYGDGELIAELPVSVEVLPHALAIARSAGPAGSYG